METTPEVVFDVGMWVRPASLRGSLADLYFRLAKPLIDEGQIDAC